MNALGVTVILLTVLAASIVAAWVNRPRRHPADPGLDQRLAEQREAANQARRLP